MRYSLAIFVYVIAARAQDFSLYTYGISPTAMAVDGAGNVYLAGSTQSNVFPATASVFQPSYSGGEMCLYEEPFPQTPHPCSDAFVIKLDPAGAIVYATYLGGNGDDQALAIAADAQGNAYVAGITSANVSGTNTFPVTSGVAFPKPDSPGQSCFLAKISPAGDKLIYSSFLPFADSLVALAVDGQGEAYVISDVDPNFQTTPGVFQPVAPGPYAAGLIKITADGSKPVYATYFSGAASLVVDSSGNAYITGSAGSSDFPVTPGAYESAQPQGGAFIAKLNPTGSELVYGTYLGGAGDSGTAIRIDSKGNAYVLGTLNSYSPPLPVTPGAFESSPSVPWAPSGTSMFLVSINSSGTAVNYATYVPNAVALDVDAAGNASVIGQASMGFPVTAGAFQRCYGGNQDVYALQLSPTGSVVGATYLGGSGTDTPVAVSALGNGRIAAAGTTNSPDFPGITNAAPGQTLLFVESFGINIAQMTACMSPGIENAASFQTGPVAAGELVSIVGAGMGPEAPAFEQIGPDGLVSTALAGVTVYFDNTPAPLLYAQANQINAIVPWEINIHVLLQGDPYAQVHVEYNGVSTNSVSVPVTPAAPGIFTVNYTTGQAAILNQDGTLNSPSNPAMRGSYISIFGTGGDFVQAGGVDGAFWPLNSLVYFSSPATVSFGALQADVLYAGSAPTLVSGVFQIDAVVPANLVPGSQTLTLQVDELTASAPITVQ
jgi:uncharacterized protein (TIGR03437 family)